jgi:hypothetical protein
LVYRVLNPSQRPWCTPIIVRRAGGQ